MAKKATPNDKKEPISFEGQTLVELDICKEVRKAFLDYSMSVIVSRALPDVRDGLKPVHRRILYTMYEAGLTHDKPYRKSATTVGDVLGKYHPHGDASVYDAMVRLAQDFSLRYPLVEGQGNFGSIDGDPPAAYRYTEARMARMSAHMLTDIRKNTVDFMPNFDEKGQEPTVLPSRFPNLLVNGSSGIAVGMATDIPPHNLCEVVDGAIALMEDPDITTEGLMQYIKGPDFPTGGIIMGRSGIRKAYETGRGKIYVRARAEIEEAGGDRYRIAVTEIPYMVRKAALIEKIADEVNGERIAGIADIRDESDKDGLRFVIELKREANPQVVLNQLYKFTDMQSTCSIINLALDHNIPKVMPLKDMLQAYVEHQRDVICRRTQYDIDKAKARAHIIEGLLKAIDYIDEVIAIIKASANIGDAKAKLIERFELTEIQAQAIVDMRLGQLTGLEREKLEEELKDLLSKIADWEDILAKPYRVIEIIKTDLTEIKEKFGDERRTEIAQGEIGIEDEDLIPEALSVFTMTEAGYIKRMPTSEYSAQHRGGRGVKGMTTKAEDIVKEMFVASSHDLLLFFTTRGRVYKIKGYEVPECSRIAKGTNIVNLLPVESDEKVTSIVHVPGFDGEQYLMMSTKLGVVKKTHIKEYANIRKSGVIAIILDEGDDLADVRLTDGDKTLMLATHNGKAIRFHEEDARPMGRVTHGVRGIKLENDDYVISMEVVDEDATFLTITENGYGKRSRPSEYKIQSRGGKGISNYAISEQTGLVAAAKFVKNEDDILLMTSQGVIMRTSVAEINILGRSTKGVIVTRLPENVKVIGVSRVDTEQETKAADNAQATTEEETVTLPTLEEITEE
ncbi:MAG: DNA gyrase subunit A [Clostridia bacterium]|nr:DNA gyrase subunit A [Clostridia bacterium]